MCVKYKLWWKPAWQLVGVFDSEDQAKRRCGVHAKEIVGGHWEIVRATAVRTADLTNATEWLVLPRHDGEEN